MGKLVVRKSYCAQRTATPSTPHAVHLVWPSETGCSTEQGSGQDVMGWGGFSWKMRICTGRGTWGGAWQLSPPIRAPQGCCLSPCLLTRMGGCTGCHKCQGDAGGLWRMKLVAGVGLWMNL